MNAETTKPIWRKLQLEGEIGDTAGVQGNGNIGVGVGKRSFTADQITENVAAVLEAIGKAKPAAFKGHYIKSVTLSSSMSPGVKLAAAEFNKF